MKLSESYINEFTNGLLNKIYLTIDLSNINKEYFTKSVVNKIKTLNTPVDELLKFFIYINNFNIHKLGLYKIIRNKCINWIDLCSIVNIFIYYKLDLTDLDINDRLSIYNNLIDPNKDINGVNIKFDCIYCNKNFKNVRSLISHMKYEKSYREFKNYPEINMSGENSLISIHKRKLSQLGIEYHHWSKGLTKETNESIRSGHEKYKETSIRKFGNLYSGGLWKRTDWNNDKDKYPEYYLSDEEIEEHNNKCHEAYVKAGKNWMSKTLELGRQKNRSSEPEELLETILTELNYDFDKWVKIGKKIADFVIKSDNLVIECDGMFKWIDNNPKIGLKDPYVRRSKFIESKGYSIIHIPSDSVYWFNQNRDVLKTIISNKDKTLNGYLPYSI